MYKNSQINYIQYLRALSVLLVFFYHLKLEIFKNGYLGVDIFFVISGYVITSRLYKDFEAYNTISLKNFFVRRFKRIYPVLLVFLITIFVIVIILSPLEYLTNRIQTLLYALFGISNFLYLFSKKDYFDTIFDDPLNHTWSLGVEEQFYLIFPIAFLLLIYLFKNNLKYVVYLLIFIIFLGVTATFLNQYNTKLVFYSPFFRFWQFLFGSVTFLISINLKYKNSYLSYLLIFLSILISASGNILENFQKVFLITIFSSMLIFCFDDKFLFKKKFLNNSFVILGNISYSFYLWHLPIIYFYDLYYDPSVFRIPLIFLLSILISFLSFKYVENKFRYYKFKIGNKILYIPILIVFCFATSIFFIKNDKDIYANLKLTSKNFLKKINYLDNKMNFSERTIFYKISINNYPIYKHCTQNSKTFKINNYGLRNECLNSVDKNNLFFIVGNSHTAHFIPMFDKLGDKINFYYLHVDLMNKSNILDVISKVSNQYNEIIFVSNISNSKHLKFFFNNLDKMGEKISGLIIGPVPNLQENQKPLECLIKQKNCYYDAIIDKKDRKILKLYDDINNNINSRNRKIFFYKPYKQICPLDICYSYNISKDLITHRDNGHLTKEGSELLEKSFYDFLNKINLL